MKNIFRLAAAAAILIGSGAVSAQTTLRASHQFPGGQGDPRDEMVQIIAREVAAANVGLTIQVFPGSSLYKANEQWGAVTRGQLDMPTASHTNQVYNVIHGHQARVPISVLPDDQAGNDSCQNVRLCAFRLQPHAAAAL